MSGEANMRAWLDPDGRHVWFEHICGGDGKIHRDMLPFPHWKSDEQIPPRVTPSIVCTRPGCTFHAFPAIEKPPEDFESHHEKLARLYPSE